MGLLDFNLARRRRGLPSGPLSPSDGPLPNEQSPYLAADPTPQPTMPFRPRVVDPATATGEAPDIVEAGGSAQQLRPRIVDEPSYYLNRYRQVENKPDYETPGWKSRIGDTLQTAGEALMQPARTQQESMSNVAQALSSATLLDPRIARERRRQRELQKIGGQYQTAEAQRDAATQRGDAALKRAQGVATYNKTVEEVNNLRNPKPNVQLVKGRGGWYAVDKNDLGTRPTKLPIDPDTPDAPPRQFDHMGVRYETVKDESGKWITRPIEGLPTDESEQTVELSVPGGPPLQVKQGQAATSLIQANTQGAEIKNRQAGAKHSDDVSLYQEAVTRTQKVTELQRQLNNKIAERDELGRLAEDESKKDAKANGGKGPNRDYITEKSLAQKRADAEASAIRQELARESAAAEATGYAYATPETNNWAVNLRPRPSAPAVEAPPALRVSKRAAPPMSENDYVAHASENWNEQKDGPFDEQRARAAYRRRYNRR